MLRSRRRSPARPHLPPLLCPALLPQVYEVVTGRVARNKMYKRKVPKTAAAAAHAAVAQQAAQLAAYDDPNSFVRPNYQAADQVGGPGGAAGGAAHARSWAAPCESVERCSRRRPRCAPTPEQPLPTGRLLTAEDVTPALVGRQAELFWPDDAKWCAGLPRLLATAPPPRGPPPLPPCRTPLVPALLRLPAPCPRM